MLSERIQKFKRIYFAVTFVVSFGLIFAFANFLLANANNTNEVFYCVSGRVQNYEGTALSNIKVSGVFFKDGESRLTDDQITDADGNFTIPGVPEGAYGSVQILPPETEPMAKYAGMTFYVDNPIATDTNIGTLTLETFVTSVSGKVVDANGQGIPKMYIEFYNPSSVKSPYPDVRVETDEQGNFDVTKN